MMDLNKANLQDLYPLSPMQQGMLFHALYQQDSRAYFEQMSYDIQGDLNSEIFKQSWQLLHNRHDVLRTVFVYKKSGKLLQMVLKHRDVEFNRTDLTALAPDQQARHIEEYRQQDRARGFALTKDRLSRLQLFKTHDDHHVMIWSVHHIIMDAWCFGIIYRELMSCYQSLLCNRPLRLPPAPPYSRYIQWLGAQDKDTARNFWRNYLQDYNVAASLYAQQQQADNYCYAKQKLSLSKKHSDTLRAAVRATQITLNTAIQAAWALLLSAHNDRNDIVFGVTVSGRPADVINVENTVGLFINTVPLRVRIDDRLSLSAFLQYVQHQALSTESYYYYSLADIQSLSELKQNLLNHVLVFENIPQADAEGSDIRTNGFAIRQTDMFEHPHYPFMLSVNPGASIELTLTYDRSVYSDVKIERAAKQLEYLLLQIAQQSYGRVAELSILPEMQQAQILNNFSTFTDEPDSRLLLDSLALRQADSPDALAVSDNNRQLSYSQLNLRSNRFAHYLIRHFGVKAEDKVAVLLSRNVDLTVALLGILKTGGAYVPLDNAYPKARIDYILEHSQAALLVTANADDGWLIPAINVEQAVNQCITDSDPGINIVPEQLAYLIYTSGSTGQPKGVMVEHGNLSSFCINLRQRFDFNENDKLLALTTISFDISVLELLCSLTVGMAVVIADDQQCHDPGNVLHLIRDHAITTLQATPSRLQWLINAGGIETLATLRIILVGGEALPESLAALLKQLPTTQVINVYGPTEATIWSTCKHLADDQLTIGTALTGEAVYILSPKRQLQAIRVTGEIVITGAGVSRGYWQDNERTAKVFTADPFRSGQRMYATGDQGRWLENGEIEFLGRNDDQIKIRGYRIELGEIERHALKHSLVAQVALVNSGNAEQSILSAFIVPISSEHTTETITIELRKHLAQWLPEFMIPSRFVVIDKLPLNSNGKVDRKALALTLGELTEPQRPYRAARNELEQQAVALWEQVLQHRPIGIDDDFFSLGGNSINAISLMTQLGKLYGKDILLSDFWTHPSISALTDALSSERQSVMVALNKRTNAPTVFCFPPIAGFGAVFSGLAEQLSCACYSFDIVTDMDWIAYSIAAIKQVQPQGPYLLLGYSAGGNYAYNVAAAMQSQGEQIRALILIDSIRITEISVLNGREKQDIIELALQESQLLTTLDKERIRSTMTAYLDFILQHPNRSELTTELFCLEAQDRDGLSLPSSSFSRDWSTSTQGAVINYQCQGNHFQILTPPQLTHNAEVIQGILDKL
jgi:iturin family lipopeptide synthetase C